MITLQEYEKFRAVYSGRKRALEELVALKQEMLRLDTVLEQIDADISRFQPPIASGNGYASPAETYAGLKSLADLSKACLKSVDGAWLSPKEIAAKLLAAGVVTNVRGLVGHITTALRRRMNSPVSPDKEIEFEKGRFRYKPTTPKKGE